MSYAPVHPMLGAGPVNDIMIVDTTQRFAAGQVIDAVDPYFGYGRFAYLMYPASQAVDPGRLLTVVDQTMLTVDLANTANLGYPVVVARQPCPSSATAQWGWFQFEGVCPIQTANSVAAGVACGFTTGTGATLANGKQLLGVKVLKASTFTLTKSGGTLNGSPNLKVSNVDGLFKGLATSGTGVASGTIASLDPSGTVVVNSGNSTATAQVTVTFTYTGFLLVHLNNPHGQGQVV